MIDTDPRRYRDQFLAARVGPGLVVDVGAAAGDFTAEMRALRPLSAVLAVEPTPAAAAALRERFRGDPLVRIAELALSDHAGVAALQRYPDGHQNSLLALRGDPEADAVGVTLDTLDGLLGRHTDLPPPEFIKIDTQGQDLAVLSGALETLRRDRPLVQAEVIFADYYAGQGSPADILALMTRTGYSLADMAMAHVDDQGRLTFADWLFSPDPRPVQTTGCACRDPMLLAAQLRIYRDAAAERLQLLERLHQAAQARQTAGVGWLAGVRRYLRRARS